MKYIRSNTYQDYKNSQIETNKAKIGHVWIEDSVIDTIVNYIKSNNIEIKNGICHGTRNGYEVENFRKKLNADIFGTEISDTATRFPNTIQWDFHDVKDEWINNMDFIYTNSWDHSYDIEKALNSWISCLNLNGRLFLHYSTIAHREEPVNTSDCLGISKSEMESILKDKYNLETILILQGQKHLSSVHPKDDISIFVVTKSKIKQI